MRCGDLLRQARAAVAADQWEKWLADNFDGSAGLARYYMEYGTKLEATSEDSDDTAQVIPSPGKSLRFSDNDRDGGSALCIEPAYREGYYYVTLVTWDRDHDFCWSHAEGPSGPILRDEIWETCQRFQFIDLIESGERTELTSTPLAFNRWLYEGHEQQHVDRQRCQGIGEVKECCANA